MAKIAVEMGPDVGPVRRNERRAPDGGLSTPVRRVLAQGAGWNVSDVICTSGPRDRAFEEQHGEVCIAIVTAGSFQYRSRAGRELMTPGSILLGNAGQYFECGHEHGVGDRCISFQYAPEYFEELAADCSAGASRFFASRLPPLRELSALVAGVWSRLIESTNPSRLGGQRTRIAEPQSAPRGSLRTASNAATGAAAWEELGVELAARALQLANDEPRSSPSASLAAEARVTRVVRMIEAQPDAEHDLSAFAREAGLSRYHFLRTFERLTGLTPHQYLLRTRLRRAATRLLREPRRVLDIALECGFGDISNFNHAFRSEFGLSPRALSREAPGSVNVRSE